GGAAHDVAPGVVVLVVDPADVTEEDGPCGHAAAAEEADLVDGRGHRRVAQAHAIARVDPVRVLDLGVVRPEARPLVRVLVVAAGDVPERVAPPHGVALRDERASVRKEPLADPWTGPPPDPRGWKSKPSVE